MAPDWGPFSPDYMVVLNPFTRLRGFERCKISCPDSPNCERDALDRIEAKMKQEQSSYECDNETQVELDRIFLQLDRALDGALGPGAFKLRI